jgi:hypothetical protein
MSRAARRYKRWERDTRASAWESARELALDLYYFRASGINLYGIGVALEPGEVPYRELWARYWTLGQPTELVSSFGRVQHVPSSWRDWGWCPVLLTSHRLLTRLAADGGRLISNWWASIGGVQVDLQRDLVTLDDRTTNWRGAYGGPAAAIISVGAVSAVHGLAALVDHPALESLRKGSGRPHPLTR